MKYRTIEIIIKNASSSAIIDFSLFFAFICLSILTYYIINYRQMQSVFT